MTDKPQQYACPDCGDDNHLYQKRDYRWCPDTRAWRDDGADDGVQCTSCDWDGWVDDAEAAAE